MSVSIKLPAEFKSAYEHVFKQDPDEGTMHLIIHELRRQLVENRLMVCKFQHKYDMNFDELKRKRIVEELNYSFEVEEDYCDWELALDGIETIKTELRKLTDYT